MATTHTGYVMVTNKFGESLNSVYVRHRRSNDPDKQEDCTFSNVDAGKETTKFPITYETGVGSDFDYWYVKIITNGNDIYECKSDFYCSISSGDDGNVKITINTGPNQLLVEFSESSGCKVDLTKISK
jgi:hypothetical protein